MSISSSSSSSFLIPRCKDRAVFLHARPEASTRTTASASALTCTLEDGTRMFLRRSTRKVADAAVGGPTKAGRLLSRSIDDLRREASNLQIAALTAQAQRAESDNNIEEDEVTSGRRAEADIEQMGLWVDKYAPREFSQLLSAEKTNRDVLVALKQWDRFVFRRRDAAASGTGSSHEDIKLSPIFTRKRTNSLGGEEDRDDDGDDDRDDEDGAAKQQQGKKVLQDDRPTNKVILLCGPPGTGKTTLAHVLARHCGYRPHEVNASDDRSAAALRDTLIQAMHGHTLSEKRLPNCIILDEIDGIDGRSSIDLLVSVVNCPLGSKRKKKSSGGAFPLTRPLICICNDQYAPALKELRKVAQVFAFMPPVEIKLVQRLRNVCAAEGLNVGASALTTLAQAAGHDIRSSLNTLQFAAIRCLKDAEKKAGNDASFKGITYDISKVLSSMIVNGLKDEQRDILTVWREIFSNKEANMGIAKRNRKIVDQTLTSQSQSETSSLEQLRSTSQKLKGKAATVAEVMKVVAEFNDNLLVLSGVFENYLKMRFNDPTFSKAQTASEWLSYGDQLEHYNMTAGYHVMGYFAAVAGKIHFLTATDDRIKVDWPSKDREFSFRRQQRHHIVQSVVETLSGTRNAFTRVTFTLDIISYLADIIAPKLRIAGVGALLSPAEIDELCRTADVMKTFGLSFASNFGDATSTVGGGASFASSVCYKCKKSGHYARDCSGGKSTGPLSAVLSEGVSIKGQLDPAIHILLDYSSVLGQDAQNALFDEEGLTARSASRAVTKDLQKVIATAVQKKHGLLTAPTVIPGESNVTGNIVHLKRAAELAPVVEDSKKSKLTSSSSGGSGRMDSFFGKRTSEPTRKPGKAAKVSGGDDVGSGAGLKALPIKAKVLFKFNEGFTNAVKRPVSISDFL